jgi:hypothetical protein
MLQNILTIKHYPGKCLDIKRHIYEVKAKEHDGFCVSVTLRLTCTFYYFPKFTG